MAGTLRLNNTGTGNGQSTITTAATGDATYTLPSVGGTFLTTSGNVTLQFASGIVSAPSVTFVDDLDTGLYSPGANQIAIATSGTAAVTVDASQRVGIGTTPDAALHVYKAGDGQTPVHFQTGNANGHLYFYNDSDGYSIDCGGNLRFVTNRSGTATPERMRLDTSGRLLVGTSSYSGNATLVLENNSSGTSYGHLRINRNTSSPADGNALGLITFSDNTTSYSADIYAARDGGTWSASSKPTRLVFSTTADGAASPTERMRIGQNGVVTIKNGAVAEIDTLTDGATITPDFAAGCNFTVTLGGNRTMANPTNLVAGQSGSIFIVQSTGSHTLTWGSYWDFPGGTAPTLSTSASAVDRVDYVVRSSTSIHTVFTANYS